MIHSGPIDCGCNARNLVYLDLATSTKQASLINKFSQEILQVPPRFLKTQCYLLGTYIISPTIFGDPGIAVLGFLFSLLFVPMGDVFWYGTL